MEEAGKFFSGIFSEIEPDRIVHAQYGPLGLFKLDAPTKAGSLICNGCKGKRGYFNAPWQAWCCFNEKCWGPIPEEDGEIAPKALEKRYPSLGDIGAPEKYRECSMANSIQPLQRIQHFTAWSAKPSGFVTFCGGAGTGKTYFAFAILAEFLRRGGANARYTNVPELYFEYRNEVADHGSAANLIARFAGADLLLLDDLGQRTPTDAYLEFLYVLINKRMENSRATIVTSNLMASEMEKRFGEAITSRLISGQNHHFEGRDRRLPKNKVGKLEAIF